MSELRKSINLSQVFEEMKNLESGVRNKCSGSRFRKARKLAHVFEETNNPENVTIVRNKCITSRFRRTRKLSQVFEETKKCSRKRSRSVDLLSELEKDFEIMNPKRVRGNSIPSLPENTSCVSELKFHVRTIDVRETVEFNKNTEVIFNFNFDDDLKKGNNTNIGPPVPVSSETDFDKFTAKFKKIYVSSPKTKKIVL